MNMHPTDKAARAEAERREDATPVLVKVHPGVFLGNLAAAVDAGTLARQGITQTLNLAVNADPPPLTLPDGTLVRRAKIGLIDGPGNHPVHLAAAVLAIEGMLAQTAPGKPSYGAHRPGPLLVHCRGGRSRSVVVTALWLARTDPRAWAEATEAVEMLRRLRTLGPEQPDAAMLAAMEGARRLLAPMPTALATDP